MRGKGRTSIIPHPQGGITPAYAGKSGTGSGPAPGPKDHPRVCGEKLQSKSLPTTLVGSPPRMRGKAPSGRRIRRYAGITPAYAGKRNTRTTGTACRRDHPRVCGEKNAPMKLMTCARGSPPRMRGKGPQRIAAADRARITPAYAGKRLRAVTICCAIQDHPRVCGEKHKRPCAYRCSGGSPPRMRGKD